MYTFVIHYADGSKLECKHIVSAIYNDNGARRTASGEEIAKTVFSVGKDMWLKSQAGSYSISGSSVRMIEVKVE